jgi:hypothetical protein
MKKTLYLLFILSSTSLFSQKLTCKDFKTGTFYIQKDSISPFDYKILRFKNHQIETVSNLHEIDPKLLEKFPELKGKFYENITWVDDCSFKLKFDGSKMKLTDSMKEMNHNGGLLIEKIKIEGKCFYYKSSMTIKNEVQSVYGKICKE